MELLEARAKRLDRGQEDTGRPSSRNGEQVTYDDNPAAFGLGMG